MAILKLKKINFYHTFFLLTGNCTYFLPIAKTPYKAAVIMMEPQPTNVDTSRQNITGRIANL